MLKTISAVLLAVSVLAAPALAAGSGKTTQAPVKAAQLKPGVLNANARMEHHSRHFRHHHRFHNHTGALKTHQGFSKVSTKHIGSATKRG
jgi:hypothetical protein